jgi:hypothetical protein
MAGKYVNNIQAIARQPPITIEVVFSVGSDPGLHGDIPRPAESISVEWSEVKWSGVK